MINFEKYVKIRPLGYDDNEGMLDNPDDEIIIEEKIDGANFRFIIREGKIVFGSRSQQLTSDDGEDTNIHKGFVRCAEYIRKKLEGNC